MNNGAEMQKVSSASADTIDSGMDHFNVRPTETSYVSGTYDRIYPVAGGDKRLDFEFRIGKVSEAYTDMAQSFLVLTVVMKNSRGELLPPEDANCLVWPGENFAHSLIR